MSKYNDSRRVFIKKIFYVGITFSVVGCVKSNVVINRNSQQKNAHETSVGFGDDFILWDGQKISWYD